MNGATSQYVFLPWLRRGISTRLGRVDDGSANTAPRATVTVGVSIGPGPSSAEVDVPLSLFGPGDVRAFDARAVVRHWPLKDVFEVEPNLFALVELVPADLPWRYTPARANASDRLRPWLALIVLKQDEIDALTPAAGGLSHPKLTTKSNVPLPNIDQLWAWAHVHVDGEDVVAPGDLQALLDTAAHRVVARLLCARRLDERTMYTAFLVPALAHAANAALGVAIDPAMDPLTPAWTNDGTPAVLPVFYSWRFQTSLTGDFASLAARIVGRILPPTVGLRPMDVAAPGLSLPAAAASPLAVESALKALQTRSTDWSAAERTTWTTALGAILNLPTYRLATPGAPRTLAPPLYGRWHAVQDHLDPAGAPPWFEDLNADPRLRVVAGLGTRVVQDDQPQLLAGAWAQVEGIREANAELRHAQLAREAATRIWTRHVAVRAAGALVAFTQPVQGRIMAAAAAGAASGAPASTIRALIRHSPLRAGVLHPAFARLARPLGPVGQRQARGVVRAASTLVQRVNMGTLRIAAPAATPAAMASPQRVGAAMAPPWITGVVARRLAALPSWIGWVPAVLATGGTYLWERVSGGAPGASAASGVVRDLSGTIRRGESTADHINRRIALRDGALSPVDILNAPPRPGFVAQARRPDGTVPPPPSGTTPEDTRFRVAAAAAFGEIGAVPAPGPTLRSVALADVSQQIVDALDPSATIKVAFAGRVSLAPGVVWNPPDPIEPVMAAPTFPQPLYEPLLKLSADWIITGLDQLPCDSVTLADTNERFIESFMVGANYEMTRTLLFNEYPTDQRGTYFRQFWDVRGYVPPPNQTLDPETLRDIKPIHAWARSAALGDNSSRVTPAGGKFLVLLVDAELFRRYPNTVVYAVQGEWKNGARDVPAANAIEMRPDFWGTLGPGIGFWGFRLTVAQARGKPSPADADAGWFFALQEHTSEPRFGLEPARQAFAGKPDGWQMLAWSDLAAGAVALSALGYVDLAAALPDVSSVVDAKQARWHVADGARASDLAYITWREPVRLLVHASRMIPPDA